MALPAFLCSPLLPLPSLCTSAPRIFCSNKRRKPKKRPAPPRPPPPQPRINTQVVRAPRPSSKSPSSADAVRQVLRSRRDLLIIGAGLPSKLSAVLSARERAEDALVILPTRADVDRAALEIDNDRRGGKLIVCGGAGPRNWAYADINANSSKKAVILVGTARAVANAFCGSAHGRPWLRKVRLLTVVDVHRIRETGGRRSVRRLLKALREKRYRKTVIVEMRNVGDEEEDVSKLVDELLREKHEVVHWDVSSASQALQRTEEIEDLPISTTPIESTGKTKSVSENMKRDKEEGESSDTDCLKTNYIRPGNSTDTSKQASISTNLPKIPIPIEISMLTTAEVFSDSRILSVSQRVMVGSHRQVAHALLLQLRLVQESADTKKAVVFFPTARLVECYAYIARANGLKILDLNSKSSPARRSRILEEFFAVEEGILFCSDLVARDTVLPTIDFVLQIGLPQTKETYLRRVGTAARSPNGRATLMIADLERSVAIRELEIEDHKVERLNEDENIKLPHVTWDDNAKRRAYESWLGYYGHCRRKMEWTRPELVEHANEWARNIFGGVPEARKKSIHRLHLRNVRGVSVVKKTAKV